MSNRITIKHLRALCDRLNEVTDSPMTPWRTNVEGRQVASIGNFHISQAYGGYCVHRMHNEGGGVTTPVSYGHIPARELFDRMHSFIDGYLLHKEQ